MKDTVKKILEILPPADKVKLGILFLLMLFGGLLEVLSIGLIAGFVSVVADPNILFGIEMLSPVVEFFGIETSRDVLIYGSAFLIIIFLLKNAYIIAYKYVKARFVYNRYRSISSRLFNVYMNTPYAFHLRRNSADLIRNVSTESEYLAGRVIMPVLQIATEGLMALGIITLLFIIEPMVTLVTLVLLGGVSLLFLKTMRHKMSYYGKEALRERTGLIKTVSEGMGGLKDVVITNRQNWFVKRFQKNVDVLARAHIFRDVTRQSVKPIMETIAVTGMLVIAITLLWEGRSVASLVSTLALFALSIQRLLPATNSIVSEYNALRYYSYAVDPIYSDLINTKTKDNRENTENITFNKEIKLSSVNYSYPQSSETVIKDVSLDIPKSTAVGVVGSTGSGKTTIIDIILGLLTPESGSVKVDGVDIQNNLEGWQKNIGYIPQSIYLSDDTIKNNIAFGIPEEEIDDQKIKEALRVARLDDFVKKLSEGTDTLIGERGVRLSGGQRQRIGIARALYNDPEVLVMDEATSSLDNITERFVIEAIERLKEDRTLIIIAHRLTTVKNCDKLYVIKEGKVIAEGSYNELLKHNGEFKLMADSAK